MRGWRTYAALALALVGAGCNDDRVAGVRIQDLRDTSELEAACAPGPEEPKCRCAARELGSAVSTSTYQRLVAIAQAGDPAERARRDAAMPSGERAEAQKAAAAAEAACSRPEAMQSFTPSDADKQAFIDQCREAGSAAKACACSAEALAREMDVQLFRELAEAFRSGGDAAAVVDRRSAAEQARFVEATSRAANTCGMN